MKNQRNAVGRTFCDASKVKVKIIFSSIFLFLLSLCAGCSGTVAPPPQPRDTTPVAAPSAEEGSPVVASLDPASQQPPPSLPEMEMSADREVATAAPPRTGAVTQLPVDTSPASSVVERRTELLTKAYVVKAGETLWTIAAEPELYGDALLWSLLYQANRDQIKDPRTIYPGQVLSVPRNLSVEELEAAREWARKSEVFPVHNGTTRSP
ncbi:MAG: LysM peptidoglycan-binding domain-containing protein [Desulfuromonadaceae bacterium]|nr:LysM peptidoglycan-binding domain-containing protein [Desulfuromonadaceae bacterium]